MIHNDSVSYQISCAVQAVGRGELIVLPTDTVYGIGTVMDDFEAVSRLKATKERSQQMPPPILVPGLAALESLSPASLHGTDELIEAFWPGALTLIIPTYPHIARCLGAVKDTVAVRMPAHSLALKLLSLTGPLAVTSANLHGQTPAISCAQAQASFGKKVSVYLDGGPTPGPVASTIVDLSVQKPRILREGVIKREQIADIVALEDEEGSG